MPDILTLKKSNCKNCYKCIRHCPVKSIRFSGNQAHIIPEECVLCGQCFVVCPQNAKQIADGVEKAKVLIGTAPKVIASLAPSFIANFEGASIGTMRAALLKLGFADAEETAVGATIVKKQYEEILKKGEKRIVITSCCHTINLLIQKYFPEALPCLADVVTPMYAHGMDIKRRAPQAKVVFIGPCISKKDEIEKYAGAVDDVLTFEELSAWLKAENISIEKENDGRKDSRARLFPIPGGILRTMDLPADKGYDYLAVSGMENCIAALNDLRDGKLRDCFIEMNACAGGCVGGPVMEKQHRSTLRGECLVNHAAGPADFSVSAPRADETARHHVFTGANMEIPGEDEIKRILRQMGKTRREDELNCGSCGYDTCREKAIAVYQGKADLSMCLPFLKEKAESFSDSILSNTPNGVVVVNDALEVQQVNQAACRMLNLSAPSDVLGGQVVCVLDPKPFMDARATGRGSGPKRIYLAEYKRYVELTIVLDREYKLMIALLRDVTDETLQKEKQDELSRQTVETADRVVDKQMRVVQEIASLLGETAAETKIALTKLKESITHE